MFTECFFSQNIPPSVSIVTGQVSLIFLSFGFLTCKNRDNSAYLVELIRRFNEILTFSIKTFFLHPAFFFCRCQLFIQPAGVLENQYRESTTYISWKEELHRSREVRCMLQCPSVEVNFLPLIVNTVALPDELSYICTHGEDWDPAYIIHLYPTLTLRNLLPYSLKYLLEVCCLHFVWFLLLHGVNSSFFYNIFSWG